jgi:capsular exopolysaccharide synthesis family protein
MQNQVALANSAEGVIAGVVSVLKTIRKHWPIVVACVVLGVGGTLLYSKSTRKVYQSSSLIEINPRVTQPLGEATSPTFDLGTLFFDTAEYYQTQHRIITSTSVLKDAVLKLSLQTDDDFLDAPHSPQHAVTPEEAAAVLGSRVAVEPVKGSRLFYLRVSDFDPKRAKRICDAVASAYLEQNLQKAVSSSSDAVVWLDGQIDHVKSDLEQGENALYDFKQKNNLPSLSINDASNMVRLEMEEYNKALTETRTRKEELLARKSELAKVTAENPDGVASSELLSNSYLQGLRSQYRTAYQERQTLLAEGKGENHPLVKEETQRVTDTKTALLGEVTNLEDAVVRDLAVIEKQEQGESALFDDARRRAVDLNMKEIEFHRLDRSRGENEKLYEMLLERMKEADLARMMHGNNLNVVEAASIAGAPIRPRVLVNVGLGLLGGVLSGLLLALFREQLDSSVKTPEDIEHKLGITFLGLLPELEGSERKRGGSRRRVVKVKKGVPELVVHDRPLSAISEAARSVRTNLMFMNPDKPYRRLLISSAAPSEGKTTVACSIAIALAQGGQRVCIVDADLRRPRLHKIFDRAGDAGLTNVLVGDASIEQVAKPTIVPNLWSIPAGPLPPNPADLLQSERFRKFMDEMGERFDRVVIDSPPLVAVTDSAIISTLVDGTVFVVRAFRTSKHASAQGLRALQDVEATIAGAVLNAVDLNRHEYSYYNYYYYKREGYRSNRQSEDEALAAADQEEGGAPPPN